MNLQCNTRYAQRLTFIILIAFHHLFYPSDAKSYYKGQCNIETSSCSRMDDSILSAGYYHTCAIEPRRLDPEEQLLEEFMSSSPSSPPVPPPSLLPASSRSKTFAHSISGQVHNDYKRPGTIKCWGQNNKGQTKAPDGFFLQVSCGEHFSCALKLDHTIECWGQIKGVPGRELMFKHVSSGRYHACGLLMNGSIKCFGGGNEFGELDAPNGRYDMVRCGRTMTCAIQANTRIVECWGKRLVGKDAPDSKTQFRQISVSPNQHVCGITISGDVSCWGRDYRGETENKDGYFYQVATGVKHSCGISSNYTIQCWGASAHPLPGSDLRTDPSTSIFRRRLTNHTGEEQYRAISLGMEHACAVDLNHAVHCWKSHGSINFGAHQVPMGLITV